jgi:tripartite-type tricarboxylate transporter receptor subunit TctC
MKANPGKFNFASTGVGSLSQLGVELLKARTNTFAVHIPYASSPLAILALLQGDVQFACVPAVAVMPQVKAGKLRPARGLDRESASTLTPDIPTMKEAGMPDVENMAWMAVMAPAVDADRCRRAHEPGDQCGARAARGAREAGRASSWSRSAARSTI